MDETVLVSDAEPNRILGLSFWDSKEDAERYHREQYRQVHETMMHLLETEPVIRTFDVESSTTHRDHRTQSRVRVPADKLKSALRRAFSMFNTRCERCWLEHLHPERSVECTGAKLGNIVPCAFTPVLAKHSKSFSLVDCLSVGVDRRQRNFEPMRKQVEAWQRSELTDVTAKVVIYEAFVEGKLEAPKHLARTVHDLYFKPKYEEFRQRTI